MPQATKKHPHNFDVPWSWIDRDEVIEEFDDDWWTDPLIYEIDPTTVIVLWLPHRQEPDDEDADWFYTKATEENYPVDVIVIDDPEDETIVEDDWHYFARDLVFDTDQVYTILDDQIFDDDIDDDLVERIEDFTQPDLIQLIIEEDAESTDSDDDWTYSRQDQDLVTDFDHVVIILDDQIDDYPLDTDDDWQLDRLVDAALVTTLDVIPVLDEDLGVELVDSDDDYIYRLDDLVFDTDQVISVLDDQIVDVEPDSDDDYVYRLDDLEFDTDHTLVLVEDDPVDPDVDDDYTYRLDDEVYDTDQLLTIFEDDLDPDPVDDDWVQAVGEDSITFPPDLTTILVLWYLIRQEPDDEDDVFIGYVETAPVFDSGEYILSLQDFDLDPDQDDDDLVLAHQDGGEEEPFIHSGKQLFEEYKPPKVVKIDSTNIDTIAFDNKTQQLKVKFKSGHTYKYHNVSEKNVKGIQKAKSAGKYFHKNIKGKYLGHKS